MELQIKTDHALESTSQSLSDEQDSVGSSKSSPPPPAPQYSIAIDRERRQVIPPKRYVEANLTAYTLNVAQGMDSFEEPSIYEEVVSSKDSSR